MQDRLARRNAAVYPNIESGDRGVRTQQSFPEQPQEMVGIFDFAGRHREIVRRVPVGEYEHMSLDHLETVLNGEDGAMLFNDFGRDSSRAKGGSPSFDSPYLQDISFDLDVNSE